MNIADEAKEIIFGDREKVYGHPAKNLDVIAGFWSTYLDKEITAKDVCNLMALMKISRLKNTPDHRDSMVDLVGYTLLQERVDEKKIEGNHHRYYSIVYANDKNGAGASYSPNIDHTYTGTAITNAQVDLEGAANWLTDNNKWYLMAGK